MFKKFDEESGEGAGSETIENNWENRMRTLTKIGVRGRVHKAIKINGETRMRNLRKS